MGSTPTSVTFEMIPWSNGEDACVTCRRVMVRFLVGLLKDKNETEGQPDWRRGSVANRLSVTALRVRLPPASLTVRLAGSD